MTLFRAQPVVDIQDIIVILVVVSVIMRRLARLGEHSPRVRRRLVLELWIRNPICVEDISRELAQRLSIVAIARKAAITS